jgi:hypothetical protein
LPIATRRFDSDGSSAYSRSVSALDRPVRGITPAKIAPSKLVDTIPTSKLNKTTFTAVGYGTEVRKAEDGTRKPTPERRTAATSAVCSAWTSRSSKAGSPASE